MTIYLDGNDTVHARTHKPPNRAGIVRAAKAVYDYRKATGRVHYTQSPSRMTIVRHKLRPPFHEILFEDCSSYATACYWLAGFPDPNGLGYNGQGYTGTLARHGRVVTLAQSKIGNLVFYGQGPPWHNVAIISDASGSRHVYSHGHEGGPRLVQIDYRSDRGEIRAYVSP